MERVARTESPQPAPRPAPANRRSRRRRPLLGVCIVVAVLLGVAAAVDGDLGMTLLAIWIGVIAGLGIRGSAPVRPRPRPVRLVLAELTIDGEVGESRTMAVVASRRTARVVRTRPRG